MLPFTRDSKNFADFTLMVLHFAEDQLSLWSYTIYGVSPFFSVDSSVACCILVENIRNRDLTLYALVRSICTSYHISYVRQLTTTTSSITALFDSSFKSLRNSFYHRFVNTILQLLIAITFL